MDGPIRLGIAIQTFTQTGATLGAFLIGIYWHLSTTIPSGTSFLQYILDYDWSTVEIGTAETMAFVTLSLCELFRAYTVRSEKVSIFKLGIFSNRYMQYAVGLSILLLLLVVNLPFLQQPFNTTFLSVKEWAVVIGLSLVPAVSEELTKVYLRWKDQRA